MVLALAFVAQGSRGVWEPDEGFYSAVALEMVQSGDWLVPRLHGEPFLDKPPLNYWGMALGMKLLGVNEWSLRAAHALWFSGTALLVGLFARRLWGPRSGPAGAVVYATMLAPFLAANAMTPDTVLTFFVTGMALAFFNWDSAIQPQARWWWAILAGVCGGLGLLAKGPAILIFALPLGLYALLSRGWRVLRRPEVYVSGMLGLALGLSWYAFVVGRLPGAYSYLVHNQISGRLLTSAYERNSDFWGAFRTYLPMLLIGTLPWLFSVIRAAGSAAKEVHRKGWSKSIQNRGGLLLALWATAPLAILFLASSRLPLYSLPVLPAMALIATKGLLRKEASTRLSA